MAVIARHPVQLQRRLEETSPLWQDEAGWALPEERRAFAFAPTSSTEPILVGENRVVVEAQLFTPWSCANRDRIIIDGQSWDVVGDPENWNLGPFRYFPGWRINLRRSDG